MEFTNADQTRPTVIDDALAEARKAAKLGERTRAYRLSLETTRINPRDINAWLLRAETAASPEEVVICLNNVLAMDPTHAVARWHMYHTQRSLLEQEPYLVYLDETRELYHVQNGVALSMVVPKEHSITDPFPPPRPKPLQPAYRWLAWALLGLLPAGVGALVLAPIAAGSALLANLHPLSEADRLRSLIIMVSSAVIWVLAIMFSLLLAVHITPLR